MTGFVYTACSSSLRNKRPREPGSAAVEAKGKLVHVALLVIWFDSALVRAEKPSFQQCSKPVNPRQQDLRRIAAVGDDGSVTEKAMTGKINVTHPNYR